MSRFPRARVDALSDGVFAFAMTLLVLDIRLPDDLAIANAADLTAHLLGLWHLALSYLISFFVLAAFWRSTIALRGGGEEVSPTVVRLSLMLLLFVTLVPFSSGLVGRYGNYAPAIMVYAGNLTILALLTIALRYHDEARSQRRLDVAASLHLLVLIMSAFVSVAVSLVAPHYAMYAYLLNFVSRFPVGKSSGSAGSPSS